jgi:putative ABC transport system permease protein
MLIENLLQDCRYAIRNLVRDPFLVLVATGTLAVCIAANTAVYSVADSILVRPLPYPNASRIDWISEPTGLNQEDVGVAPDYFALRERNRIFEVVAAFDLGTANWTGVERPEQLEAAGVSPEFFHVLGTPPLIGRSLAADEVGPTAPFVAILSYAFWRNRLGSDPHIVGKTIALDRLPRTIIGVMPQGFDFPRGTQLWLPATLLDKATQSFPLSPNKPIVIVSMLALRKPGVTARQAAAEMNRLTFLIRSLYPVEFRNRGFRQNEIIAATPLQEHLAGQLRPALLAFTGAVVLVLLIACANIANLLLARAAGRHRELAVRLALGSGRRRVLGQMLTESAVLAVPGGLVGIGLAFLAVDALKALKPAILVRYPPISMDWRVLIVTVALLLATSMLFGIVPALSAAAIRIHDALKSCGRTQSSGRGAAGLRKGLVVAELGVSLVLLIGAALVGRSFLHLARAELGFSSDHLLTFRVNAITPFGRNNAGFYDQILERLENLSIVRAAALTTDIPLSDRDFVTDGAIRVVGRPIVPFTQRPRIENTSVSPQFFEALRIPLKSGRIFNAHDFAAAKTAAGLDFLLQSEAVLVNESFVRRIFPGENPLGRQLGFGPDEYHITWTIVGVVGDTRTTALGEAPPPMIYRCTCSGLPIYFSSFVVRTSVEPKTAIRAIEQQVGAVDRDVPIYDLETMGQRRNIALAPERFELFLLGSFAFMAILLAAAGVYGTMSYLVSRRTREIGIRVALGATPRNVLGLVFQETTLLVSFAIASGLAGAWALTRFLRSMLFGVDNLDPATFLLTSVFLAVIVLIASLGPVRTAVRVDPLAALRDE